MQDITKIQFRIADSFFRHRWLFLLCIAAVMSAAVAVLFIQGRGYTASGRIYATADAMAQSLGRDAQHNTWKTLAQINSRRFLDFMKDNKAGGFVDRAIQRSRLARPISVDPKAADPRLAELLKGVTCDTESDETFVIALNWSNRAEGERIVEALRDEFLALSNQNKREVLEKTRAFLDTEITAYEKRMRAAEQALIDFKVSNLSDSPEAGAAAAKQLAELRNQLDDLTITSRDAGLRREALRQRISQIKPTSILEQTIADDPRLRKLKELETDRALLLAQFKVGSDEIQAVDTQIASLQHSLAEKAHMGQNVLETKLQDNPEFQALHQQLTDAEIEGRTRASQMQLLRQRILDYMTRVQALPNRQRALTDRTRSYSILKTQYENLLKQREEAEIQGDLQVATAQASGLGTGPLQAIGVVGSAWSMGVKKLALMGVGSIVLGLALAVLVVIISEWLDPSIRYVEDAEQLFGVPVLLSLPETRDLRVLPSKGAPRLPGANKPLSA